MTHDRNKNRPGYKETKVGWIPASWGWSHLNEIAEIDPEVLIESTSKDFSFYYIDLSSVKSGQISLPVEKITFGNSPSRARKRIQKNDVLLATVRPNLQGFAYVDFDSDEYICSTGFAVIRSKADHSARFVYQSLYSTETSRYFYACVVGTGYPALNSSDVNRIIIPLPPLPEQRKIAEILSCWDEGLERLEKLIEAKKLRKKGLMQKLLTGGKRLPGFRRAEGRGQRAGWREVSLNQLMKESRVPGTDGAKAKKLTVKLHGKGVTEKNETRAGSDATKYYRRTTGQFIYSKLDFLNGAFGIIPSHLDGYESTLDLPSFDLRDEVVNKTWLISFLTREEFYTSCHALANGGRKARRINPKDFKHIKFPLPPLEEQKAIAEVLETADEEICLLEAERDALAEQKKGLMQKLLTGEMRCPDFMKRG